MAKRALTVGKRVGGAHRDALAEIPAAERLALNNALAIAGEFEWNVARIEQRRVALLDYDDLDTEHFPTLRHSLLVDLATHESRVRDFTSSDNPPILHRKELLLRTTDPRRERFAALTAALDARGLFARSHTIGLRKPWQQRLEKAGIIIQDHRIIEKEIVHGKRVRVDRHRTAMARNGLSSPMQMLARHGFIDVYPDVFDYGCGQGDDIRILAEVGISAAGWDPHFRREEAKRPAELVNLGFVLNVIEEPRERIHALQEAWSLCRKVMAVAVMVEGHYPVQGLTPFADGFFTSRGTFQKYFSPHELRTLVRDALDAEPVAVAPGIVFLFRDPEDEQEFLFRRRTRHTLSQVSFAQYARPRIARVATPLPERLRPVLEQLWARAIEFGRAPDAEEIPDIRDSLVRSNVSISRGIGWCRSIFDEAQLESAARRRREDLLVHFALGAFSGSRAFNALPPALRRDVRHFFGSFGAAQSEARRFLFSLGTDGTIEEACAAAIQARLVHSHERGRYHFDARQLEELPAAIRTFVGCAAVLVGDADDASLVVVNLPKRSVAFYFSPDFGAPLLSLIA